MHKQDMRMLVRVVMVQGMAVPQAIADRANGIPFAFASSSVFQGETWHYLRTPEV